MFGGAFGCAAVREAEAVALLINGVGVKSLRIGYDKVLFGGSH